MRAPMIKKIQFVKEKCKIRRLRTQLNFMKGLIAFMKVLIAKTIDFGVNLGFNYEKLIF